MTKKDGYQTLGVRVSEEELEGLKSLEDWVSASRHKAMKAALHLGAQELLRMDRLEAVLLVKELDRTPHGQRFRKVP